MNELLGLESSDPARRG